MTNLLLDWLARRANDYLIWMHERDHATYPPCPDCGGRGDECYCEEKADRDQILNDAFEDGLGYERGYQCVEGWFE